MAKKMPGWDNLWAEYPDYIHFTSEQVKKLIGGAVDAKWITNTCAVRLSRTLNYNGIPVPWFPGLNSVRGADKKRYAYRVREVEKWLLFDLGKPGFVIRKKAGDAFDKTTLKNMRGIIGFDIRFSDATGHLDLWDGSIFSSEHSTSRNYWDSATKIWLWQTTNP